jgi:hypothetical protein
MIDFTEERNPVDCFAWTGEHASQVLTPPRRLKQSRSRFGCASAVILAEFSVYSGNWWRYKQQPAKFADLIRFCMRFRSELWLGKAGDRNGYFGFKRSDDQGTGSCPCLNLSFRPATCSVRLHWFLPVACSGAASLSRVFLGSPQSRQPLSPHQAGEFDTQEVPRPSTHSSGQTARRKTEPVDDNLLVTAQARS